MTDIIISLIRSGKTEEALNQSLDYFSEKNNEASKVVMLLLNQYSTLRRQKLLGLEDKNEQENRIVKALIDIISDSSKENYSFQDIIIEVDAIRKVEEDKRAKRLIQRLGHFCSSVQGYWLSGGSNSGILGFVLFRRDQAKITIQIRGEAYNMKGEMIYQWNSVASSIDLESEKLHYIWEGYIYEKVEGMDIRRAKEPKNRGWGEIVFKKRENEQYLTAIGQFFDTELQDSNELKISKYRRCDSEVIGVIESGDPQEIGNLVKSLLNKI